MSKKLINYTTDKPMPLMRRFDLTKYDWYNKQLGRVLPLKEAYNRENMLKTELWILWEDFKLTLCFDDGTKDIIEYKAGFVWDIASVPSILRSFIDNDAYIVFIGALFHDGAFGLHLYSYEDSNTYFRDLIIITAKNYAELWDAMFYEDITEWVEDAEHDAKLYYFGVETRKGERIYKSSDVDNHWNSKFITKVELC
jgi:hypothetical protein